MATFTPAQQAFYDALMNADRQLVEIVRKALEACQRDGSDSAHPENFGAPLDTPAWTAIDKAAKAFGKAIGATSDRTCIEAALPVIDAALAHTITPER